MSISSCTNLTPYGDVPMNPMMGTSLRNYFEVGSNLRFQIGDVVQESSCSRTVLVLSWRI